MILLIYLAWILSILIAFFLGRLIEIQKRIRIEFSSDFSRGLMYGLLKKNGRKK